MRKFGIIGCGAWGVTIAKILHENQQDVTIWCHNQEFADYLKNRTHPNLLDIELTEFQTELDLRKIILNSDILVIALASNYLKILEQFDPKIFKEKQFLILTKGLVEDSNTIFVSDYLYQKLGNGIKLAVLSGPNIAIEIAQKLPTATVIAGKDQNYIEDLQKQISNQYFRVYTSDDIRGVEIGGILKNIMAIAAGTADGFGFGYNSKSALITRALVEIIRFGQFYKTDKQTFLGLSGLGDLITTCSSPNSRNWQTGYKIAKQEFHYNPNQQTQIAEGIKSAKIIREIAIKNKIEMPITNEIYEVIFQKKNPLEALKTLMTRDLKTEFY